MAVKEDKRVILKIIKDYAAVLRENGISVKDIYLFGSHVTGKSTEESDIDIAVFLDQEEIDSFQEDLNLMRLRRKVDLRIEPHSFAKTDLAKPDPFVKKILTTGKRIL
jgi:uncharacterized protein